MEKNNAPLLEMRNIKKGFFGNQVLTDINFTLKEGEVLGLVGENGAGKSTLMKILFGMDVSRETGGYEGDVLIDGEKVQFNTPFDALKAGIGMVHQEFSLIPGFTATENILLNREPKKKSVISEVFGPRLDTLDYKEMDNRAAKAIEKMGVAIDQKMVISSMPVGHKQFTEIARELSKENLKLLILDEPTAVLTEQEAQALLGTQVLRIVVFSEPLFGASIVTAGVFQGAGSSLLSSVLNFVSMWGVRITLTLLLVPHWGLRGAWIAMCIELCFRGSLFLFFLWRKRWLPRELV